MKSRYGDCSSKFAIISIHQGKVMKRNHFGKKGLAIGIILLFIGVAVAPSINADIDSFEELSHKTTMISCQYVTYTGIEKIEKEISIDDYEHLIQLLHGSEDNATVSELEHLGLLPEGMTVQRAKEIISGEYGKKKLENYKENNLKNFFINDDSIIKKNMFCAIQGSAVDSYFLPFWWLAIMYGVGAIVVSIGIFLWSLDTKLRELFDWYPLFEEDDPVGLDLLQFMVLFILGFNYITFNIFPEVLIGRNIPLKLTGYVGARLFAAFNVTHPILNTLGLLGQWSIENYRSIDLSMIGFTGLWINIPDIQQVDGCEFKGFCLYVSANAKIY
jgi:hypothetical protein